MKYYKKIISHRGNLNGRIPEKENTIEYINLALNLNYEVEIDVRVKNGLLFLGHDIPENLVNMDWLNMNIEKLWIHCKDIEAYKIVSKLNKSKYFCHTHDPFSLVSTNHLWVHDLNNKLNEKCIIPLLSLTDIENYKLKEEIYAICTDYVNKI